MHVFENKTNVFKYTANLSFECRLFYPTEMVLTQYGSTLLNWSLKTLKDVKEFKSRNASTFSWMHVFENATNVFKHTVNLSLDCRLFYPTEMVLTQHDSTLLNSCLKTLKNVKKLK